MRALAFVVYHVPAAIHAGEAELREPSTEHPFPEAGSPSVAGKGKSNIEVS